MNIAENLKEQAIAKKNQNRKLVAQLKKQKPQRVEKQFQK